MSPIFWIVFHVVVLAILALDLFVLRRKAETVSTREAAIWSVLWVILSLGFCAYIWKSPVLGPEKGLAFLTGYLVEYSLSIDNIFVFVLIFRYFRVPEEYQHRVLFWGILGALLMRGGMIVLSAALIKHFEFILYFFGAFLVYAGIKFFFGGEPDVDPSKNVVLRFVRRLVPITDGYRLHHFTARENGRFYLTPLALVLVMVETTDLIFAVDSIPAILGITTDTFIVYTSNVCAILGLRSLYFLLANLMHRFAYLKYGLAFVLCFIGVKMLLLIVHVKIDMVVSLLVVFSALSITVIASWLKTRGASPEEVLPVTGVDPSVIHEPPIETEGDGKSA